MPITKLMDGEKRVGTGETVGIEYGIHGFDSIRGSEEASPIVIFIHGSIIADSFLPLIDRLLSYVHITSSSTFPFLRSCLISYRRRGYGLSSQASPHLSIADQAQDCIALLRQLHIKEKSIHVVGHSVGGIIALQLAIDAPNHIGSISLIEPSLLNFIPSTQPIFEFFFSLLESYKLGNRLQAFDTLMKATSGPNYKEIFDRMLPAGWYDQALNDIGTLFEVELPSLQKWKFGSSDDQSKQNTESIKQPILSVIGGAHLASYAKEEDILLHKWFPNQINSLVVPGSLHWPHITNTGMLAEVLANFILKCERRQIK